MGSADRCLLRPLKHPEELTVKASYEQQRTEERSVVPCSYPCSVSPVPYRWGSATTHSVNVSGIYRLTAFWPVTAFCHRGQICQWTTDIHLWVLRESGRFSPDPDSVAFQSHSHGEGRGSLAREEGLDDHTLNTQRNMDDKFHSSLAPLSQPCQEFYKVTA